MVIRLGAVAALLLTSCSPVTPPPLRGLPELGDVLHQPLRPTDPEALFHYDADSAVASYAPPGSPIRVHYATAGRHRTIMTDVDRNGTPDFVELVAETAQAVWTYWADLGVRTPLAESEVELEEDGGDELFDLYLVDFDIASDGYFGTEACTAAFPGQCAGYMIIENDFAEQGYPDLRTAVRILVSHELFHGIQAAYVANLPTWWSEATAVWAEEAFDPAQEDFEALLDGYFDHVERSLDAPLPGPVDPFSYGLAIFPQYLAEQHGPTIVPRTLEAIEATAAASGELNVLAGIERTLTEGYQTDLSAAYGDFAVRNLFTGRRHDPARGYVGGHAYPTVAYTELGGLPWEGSARVFHLGSRYFILRTQGREQVTAALTLPATDPLPPLQVALLAQRANGSAGELIVYDPLTAGRTPPVLSAVEATQLVVAVSNLAVSGNSVRVGICAGTPAEVEACLPPPDPEPSDGGVADGDVADGGVAGSDATLEDGEATPSGDATPADQDAVTDVTTSAPDHGPEDVASFNDQEPSAPPGSGSPDRDGCHQSPLTTPSSSPLATGLALLFLLLLRRSAHRPENYRWQCEARKSTTASRCGIRQSGMRHPTVRGGSCG